MKIYSDKLTTADLREALPPRVDLAVLEILPRPRKRRNGWVVSLSGTSPYRSQMSDGGHQAATWDEHGLWMAELYRRDPDAVIGWYKTLDDFIAETAKERDRCAHGGGPHEGYRRTHSAPWLYSGTSALRPSYDPAAR